MKGVFFIVGSLFILFASRSEGQYNENPCKSKDAVCKYTWNCPGAQYVSGECPSQSNNVKCCYAAVNESPCKDDGQSQCLNVNYKQCSGGSFVSGQCPTQATDIKCCKKSSSGGGTCPSIVSRSEWGARPPKRTLSTMASKVRYAFVHHTTGGSCSTRSTCASKVKSIQYYHQYQRPKTKFTDIGYSFLIGGEGSIFEGRGFRKVGAHTYGYNSVGYGIAFIGEFGSKSPTAAAVNSFHRLVNCLVARGDLRSNYDLKGHRQMKATTCPGDTLYNLVKTWPRYAP